MIALIPHNIILTGRAVQFILQQIAFGVKQSSHAVELCMDLADRMNAGDLKAMSELFAAKIATTSHPAKPHPRLNQQPKPRLKPR